MVFFHLKKQVISEAKTTEVIKSVNRNFFFFCCMTASDL